MMPELVVIKGFKGKALIRWMIADVGTHVEITDDAGAMAVRMGKEPAHKIGVRKSEVYLAGDVGIEGHGEAEWANLARRF